MIPGITSKISEELVACATTIKARTDLVRINSTTSTTVIATITPAFGGFSGVMILTNESGANITTVTTGNIMAARTIPVNMPILFVYSKEEEKWFPGAIS